MSRPRVAMIERFWNRVTKSDGCWTMANGKYSKIRTPPPEKRTISGHRFSWELHFGPVPAGLQVCHRCNNKACVRPEHLYLATVAINIHDAMRDGLKPSLVGEKNPQAKINHTTATIILTRCQLGQPTRAIAEDYGVSLGVVRRIRNRETWNSLTYA